MVPQRTQPTCAWMPASAAIGTEELLGCVVKCPSGWGIVTVDDAASVFVQVALDDSSESTERRRESIRRDDIMERSFCAVGRCVQTTFGSGVLLDFRRNDLIHVVRIWQPRGKGAATLFCRASDIRCVVAAAVGFPASTSHGKGIVRRITCSRNSTARYLVELESGSLIEVAPAEIHSPTAAALPVAEGFKHLAEHELSACMRTLCGIGHDLSSINPAQLLVGSGNVLNGAAVGEAGRIMRDQVQVIKQRFRSTCTDCEDAENPNSKASSEGDSHGSYERACKKLWNSNEMKELTSKFKDTSMGQVLAHGVERLQDQAQYICEVDKPQVDRLKERMCHLTGTLLADDVVHDKSQQLLAGAWQVVDKRLGQYSPVLAAQAGSIANTLSNQCAGVIQQCGELLSARIELGITNALEASSLDPALAGAELLERFHAIGSKPSSVASVPAGQTLAMLDGLGLPLPESTRQVLTRVSDKPLETAVLHALDEEELACKAERILKKGEVIMEGIHQLTNSETVAGVLQNIESDVLEKDVLDGLKRFSPEAFLQDCDKAIVDKTARESFINKLLDICLDFLLRILPDVKIPEIAGTHRGTAFRIYDLDMSGIRFKKEDVVVSLLDFRGAAVGAGIRAVTRAREADILRLEAQQITAQFQKLICKVKPPVLPESQLLTNGTASGISVSITLATKTGEMVKPRISKLQVKIESLELTVEESTYARLFNSLIGYLNEYLKRYICGVLEENLKGPLGQMCEGLNDLLAEAQPLLTLLGWPVFAARAPTTSMVPMPAGDLGALKTLMMI